MKHKHRECILSAIISKTECMENPFNQPVWAMTQFSRTNEWFWR